LLNTRLYAVECRNVKKPYLQVKAVILMFCVIILLPLNVRKLLIVHQFEFKNRIRPGFIQFIKNTSDYYSKHGKIHLFCSVALLTLRKCLILLTKLIGYNFTSYLTPIMI